MTRVRVLHVVVDLKHGGLQHMLVDLSRAIDPTRFETHVAILVDPGALASKVAENAEVHTLLDQSRFSMIRPTALARLIRRVRPQVVHSHSGAWYKSSLAARIAAAPLVAHTDHGRPHPDPWAARKLDGWASRRTDVVVAVSAPLAEQLRATVVAKGTNVVVIPNGVDTDMFAPDPADGTDLRREMGVAPDRLVIGSIGRLEPVKGYDILIGAFAELLRHWGGRPRPLLLLAGDGRDRPELQSLARSLGIAEDVRFLGWRSDARRLYRTFDVFALGSRSEGTSVSLLEAMSSGVCPVVTDVGGNSRVLGSALAHRLVPPGDPVAQGDALARVLGDGPSRVRDAKVGRQRVMDAFSLEAMARAYERVYIGGPVYQSGEFIQKRI